MSEIEIPECPVCLNPFSATSTVPRVLPCGHSICQHCISLLSNPFPDTIRCPSCTFLVKLTPFPKNIDLLRFSCLLQSFCDQKGEKYGVCLGLDEQNHGKGYLDDQNLDKSEEERKNEVFLGLDEKNHEKGQLADQNLGKYEKGRNFLGLDDKNHEKGYLDDQNLENCEEERKNGVFLCLDEKNHEKGQSSGFLTCQDDRNYEKEEQNEKNGVFSCLDENNHEKVGKTGVLACPDEQNLEKSQKCRFLACPDNKKVQNTEKRGGNGAFSSVDEKNHEKGQTSRLLACPDDQNHEKAQKIGSLHSLDNYNKGKVRKGGVLAGTDYQFVPNLWTKEFFLKWEKWVVSENGVVLEMSENDGFYGTVLGKYECGDISVVKIGSFGFCDDSKLRYSYVSKIMLNLFKMRDSERDELETILRVSCLRQVCKVYGVWFNADDQSLYMVSERYVNNLGKDICKWRSVFIGEYANDELFRCSSFAMIFMEICEAISCLHSEGLFFGCLNVGCFCFDEFGHVYIDLNETLVASRRLGRLVKKVVLDSSFGNDAPETLEFISPEIFIQLLKFNGFDAEYEIKLDVGHGSDVWSLACVLLTLLRGELFLKLATFEGSDYIGFYKGLKLKVEGLLQGTQGSEIESLHKILGNCFLLSPRDRPLVTDMWKCIRKLFIKPPFDIVASISQIDKVLEKKEVCLFWGELCKLGGPNNGNKTSNILQDKGENGKGDDVQVGESSRDLVEGLSEGHIKCIDLKGHLDCVTGLAVGGGYLFSSSYDKTVKVWSLQDFSHVHTFKGHEHKVMALVFLDKEQPLCISGDGGGAIFIWVASSPLGQEPIKKIYEQKDWRYSGIHCLAVSGSEYLYTGSGDKSIKAWSLQDYTLSSVMNGHNSVVSTLAVCGGVLYSGSWDGTVRLWCLSDHSPLAVLGEAGPGNLTSVLSLAAYGEVLAVAHENGLIKIWRNNDLLKCVQAHKGAIFSVAVWGKWLFTGGWDKAVNVQELLGDEFQADAISIGSIACDAVITALFYWQGKLFLGQADRIIKVYNYGS